MIRNRIFALFAFAWLLAFLGVYVVRVSRIDLHIVIGLTVLLVAYDLWTQIGPRKR